MGVGKRKRVLLALFRSHGITIKPTTRRIRERVRSRNRNRLKVRVEEGRVALAVVTVKFGAHDENAEDQEIEPRPTVY